MSKRDRHAELVHHLRHLRPGTLQRRELMRWAVSAGFISLIGCGGDDDAQGIGGSGGGGQNGGGGAGRGAGSGGGSAAGGCSKIPEETAGPYPADGSNGAGGGSMPGGGGMQSGGSVINVLAMAGIVRSDIRSSFGSSTALAEGVPLTIKLRIVDTATSCEPLANAAVYIWHCDRGGNYSLYSSSVTSENYLRGVQVTDDEGWVTFESIFPACYSGRWPHIHFEVYPSEAMANSYAAKIATSQMALPKAICDVVFAESGYSASVSNLAKISLASDNVFSDGVDSQTPEVSGSVSAGYTASLTAAVSSK